MKRNSDLSRKQVDLIQNLLFASVLRLMLGGGGGVGGGEVVRSTIWLAQLAKLNAGTDFSSLKWIVGAKLRGQLAT